MSRIKATRVSGATRVSASESGGAKMNKQKQGSRHFTSLSSSSCEPSTRYFRQSCFLLLNGLSHSCNHHQLSKPTTFLEAHPRSTMLETRNYNALSLAQPTNFKAMLASGEYLWGTGCRIAHPEAARILATTPYHFCFIDAVCLIPSTHISDAMQQKARKTTSTVTYRNTPP